MLKIFEKHFLQKSGILGPVIFLVLILIFYSFKLVTASTTNHSQKDTSITEEWKRTKPDVVVYIPKDKEDGDNEHFLVFNAPRSKELLAIWTQSSVEGRGDNRAVIARSKDGKNWSAPEIIAGRTRGQPDAQASWAFPVVSKKGRIYCFYSKDTVLSIGTEHHMMVAFSDDNGITWIKGRNNLPVPKFKYDDAGPSPNAFWIIWQKPIRDGQGKYFSGYTRWSNEAVVKKATKNWTDADSRAGFVRFENIDDNPLPEDIVISWLPENNKEGLEVAHKNYPISVAQEPAVVLLPDKRLFTVMRTMTGYIWYSVSDDNGNTWRKPEVLRYKDGGEPVPQPLSSSPLYSLSNKKYLLLFANNDGRFGKYDQFKENWGGVNQANFIRQPAFISLGEFRPGARQPLWFSEPKMILTTNNVPIGPKGTAEVATYPSITERQGVRTLWYPDRKYFLLGKYLPDTMLNKLIVPK